MEAIKFHELCNAFDHAQKKFDSYKTDCHLISMEIVKELKSYFNVPESQFTLYRINENNRFELVPSALIHAINLVDGNYWHFGIGLTVCKAPDTLSEELILIHLMYRKNLEGDYFIKQAQTDTEFEIVKGNSDSYKPFFDDLFNTIIKSYDDQLQPFVGDKTTRKLGYRH